MSLALNSAYLNEVVAYSDCLQRVRLDRLRRAMVPQLLQQLLPVRSARVHSGAHTVSHCIQKTSIINAESRQN